MYSSTVNKQRRSECGCIIQHVTFPPSIYSIGSERGLSGDALPTVAHVVWKERTDATHPVSTPSSNKWK